MITGVIGKRFRRRRSLQPGPLPSSNLELPVASGLRRFAKLRRLSTPSPGYLPLRSTVTQPRRTRADHSRWPLHSILKSDGSAHLLDSRSPGNRQRRAESATVPSVCPPTCTPTSGRFVALHSQVSITQSDDPVNTRELRSYCNVEPESTQEIDSLPLIGRSS